MSKTWERSIEDRIARIEAFLNQYMVADFEQEPRYVQVIIDHGHGRALTNPVAYTYIDLEVPPLEVGDRVSVPVSYVSDVTATVVAVDVPLTYSGTIKAVGGRL